MRYSSHVSRVEHTAAARRTDGLEYLSGAGVTEGDVTKWRQARRNTRDQSPVAEW